MTLDQRAKLPKDDDTHVMLWALPSQGELSE
jgi:hypothetical protein